MEGREMKAEDQTDDEFAICPYCQHRHYMESEDYNQSGTVMECDNCKMSFHYTTQFSVSHTTHGDCELNRLVHRWDNYSGTHRFCDVCDKCRSREESE